MTILGRRLAKVDIDRAGTAAVIVVSPRQVERLSV
jgi:hypothetical protein